jgi:histone H3/H4
MKKKNTRRFEAKQETIVHDIQIIMKKLRATSLRIDQNMMDSIDSPPMVRIIWDRGCRRYISECAAWPSNLDNLRAAQLAIDYTWRIAEAYGVSITDKASDGLLERIFGALEAPLDPNILLLGEGTLWWEILGIDPQASKATIVNAYRALSKVHHPDVGGNPDDFIRLQNAYRQGIEQAKG